MKEKYTAHCTFSFIKQPDRGPPECLSPRALHAFCAVFLLFSVVEETRLFFATFSTSEPQFDYYYHCYCYYYYYYSSTIRSGARETSFFSSPVAFKLVPRQLFYDIRRACRVCHALLDKLWWFILRREIKQKYRTEFWSEGFVTELRLNKYYTLEIGNDGSNSK